MIDDVCVCSEVKLKWGDICQTMTMTLTNGSAKHIWYSQFMNTVHLHSFYTTVTTV